MLGGMRIASYNIRKAVGLDWRRDPNRIVDVIGEVEADIVVLQEADKRLGGRPGVLPLERLKSEQGFELARPETGGQSHGWHGNALLYRPSDIAAPRIERIELPAREPRGAIAAHFDTLGLIVIGTHLALTSGIRKKQMQTLCAFANQSGKAAIIAGDFNHWGAHLPAGQNEVITPGLSFHASRQVAALDRFVLSGGIKALGSRVHKSMKARHASDHLPVVMDFKISKECQACG